MSKNSLHAHIQTGKIWLEALKAEEKTRTRRRYDPKKDKKEKN